MNINLPEKINELYYLFKNVYFTKEIKYHFLSWYIIWENINNFPLINNDLKELLIDYRVGIFPFWKKITKYLNLKFNTIYIYNFDIDMSEWYNVSIEIYKSEKYNKNESFPIWWIMISGFLKYYRSSIKNNDKILEKEIKNFLKENWYQELTPELWNIELDIVWNNFMSYDSWVEKAKFWYKEWFTDDNDYYNLKNEKNKDREKDFEEYCKWQYDWPYIVKHLLFWESFIWELK